MTVLISGPVEGRYCVRELEADVTSCTWFDTVQECADFISREHPASQFLGTFVPADPVRSTTKTTKQKHHGSIIH